MLGASVPAIGGYYMGFKAGDAWGCDLYIGLKTFQAIIKDKRFKNIPKILEIPERDTKTKINLKLLRKLRF